VNDKVSHYADDDYDDDDSIKDPDCDPDSSTSSDTDDDIDEGDVDPMQVTVDDNSTTDCVDELPNAHTDTVVAITDNAGGRKYDEIILFSAKWRRLS